MNHAIENRPGMSALDIHRLDKVKRLPNGSIRAACPACRAAGSDKSGEHLLIQPDGRFGCAAHPNDRMHRQDIFRLAASHKFKIPENGNAHGHANGHARAIVDTYPYRDAAGKLLFEVVRYAPKDFRQRRPDPAGPDGWTWNTKDVEKVLFRLPEIIRDVKRGLPIILCEGEKDALAMAKCGFSVTCNPGGAGKWQDSFSEILRGADVTIIADKDATGRAHAQLVASKLHGIAKFVRVIELPDMDGKTVKDPADFFAAGGDVGQIIDLIDGAQEWKPAAKPASMADNGDLQSQVRGSILRLLLDGTLSQTEQRARIADAVVNALCTRGKFFCHAQRKDFDSAMYFDGERKQLLRIRADHFQAWLADWLAVNRADSIFKFIASAVETTALAGEQTTAIVPERFWASRPGAIYLSCGDGQAAKITAGNVKMVDNGTDGIVFAAGDTLAKWELTAPRDPFESCSLFRNANYAAPHGLDLTRLWSICLPANPPNKPPLCSAGDIGSGKTRHAGGIAELYGLPVIIHKADDNGEDSFWASMDGGGLFTLDNCDTKIKWLPDALATAATGGCSQRRKKYTDAERVTLRANAWLCLTSANPTFASDSGLADRLILIRMNRRVDETSDGRLSDEIREHRDAGLSFIAQTLATALADTRPMPGGLNQRHPDFAALAVRIGRALGRETETIAALKSAEMDKSLFCLENDSIGAVLLAYLNQAGQFIGTSAELRDKLIEHDPELAEYVTTKRLGRRFSALMPHLQRVLETAQQEKDRKGFVKYTFKVKSAESAESQMPF